MCFFPYVIKVNALFVYLLFIVFNSESIDNYELTSEYFCDSIPKTFCMTKISNFCYLLQGLLLSNWLMSYFSGYIGDF